MEHAQSSDLGVEPAAGDLGEGRSSGAEEQIIAVIYDVHKETWGEDTLLFSKGRFDRPLLYGPNLLFRMNSMKSGWVLAPKFNQQFTGVLQRQPAHPKFAPGPDLQPDAPKTFSELESALRAAIDRDPTQPWHLFYLGQALWAQGETEEAGKIWQAMMANDFPGVPI